MGWVPVGRVEDLVVKHREVEGEAQSDGMGGGQLCCGVARGLIRHQTRFSSLFPIVTCGELRLISVIITFPE